MRMYQLKCPSCGASVEVEQDRKMLFCSYCGGQILVDDDVKRVEITKNINYHRTYTDEAKIREHERKEKVQLKQMEYDDREKKRNNGTILICIGILISLMLFSLGMSFMFEQAEKPADDEVKVPFSSSDLEGNHFDQVISDLENAGFSNISVKEQKDLVFGLITKDGSVAKVSINGDSDFDEGDIFPNEAIIVVTYHTFKE